MAVTTWNPADKDSSITLSNGDLTATGGTNAYRSVRSTTGKSTGKWYCEITLDAGGANGLVGVGNSTFSLANYVGADVNGWGWQGSFKYHNGSGAYGSGKTTGDIISILLDMDAGTITLWKNGTTQGEMYNGLSGTLYVAFSSQLTGDAVTANFGASAFAYTMPGGYSAWNVEASSLFFRSFP